VGEASEGTVEVVLSIPLATSEKLVIAAAEEEAFPRPALKLKLQRPRLSGDDMDYLQFLLQLRGQEVGEIDGAFGPMTEVALKGFQGEAGLPATAY
jgi:peptidoglycan hydrolase-like protein with peptidoglycan-binding domain